MKFFFISWCCGNTYHCRLAQCIMILSWWYKMFAWSLCVLFTNKDGLITARTYTINYHLGTCIPYDHAFLRLRAKIKDFFYFFCHIIFKEISFITSSYVYLRLLQVADIKFYHIQSLVVKMVIWPSSLSQLIVQLISNLVMHISPLCFDFFKLCNGHALNKAAK